MASMKREYIKPTMACIMINSESLIALSKGGEITDDNANDFEVLSRDDDESSSSKNMWEWDW